MRLFIALDVSEDIIDYLKQQQLIMKEKIDQSQFKFVDEFHLTLLFLGEQSEDEMKRINQALDTVSFESFDLKLTTLGKFPKKGTAKVVWAGLNSDSMLLDLRRDIERRLDFLKLGKDHKFHPHLTLARVKHLSDKENEALAELINEPLKQLISKIGFFKLYKSTLTPEGPLYQEIKSFSAQW